MAVTAGSHSSFFLCFFFFLFFVFSFLRCVCFCVPLSATYGGAILLSTLQQLHMQQSTFNDNSGFFGGAIAVRPQTILNFLPGSYKIDSSTFDRNQATIGQTNSCGTHRRASAAWPHAWRRTRKIAD